MKIFGNVLIFLLCSFSVFGQENSTLAGTLLDKADNEPIIAGSVTLLQSKDSALVTGAISDVAGRFSFKDVPSGKYILKISYLGYTALTKNITVKAGQSAVDLGKLYLEADAILLKEAIVEGKKPEVIVKNDTIEYDAGSYKVADNAVVEDLLKKLPGVEVDKDGKITVNGKEVKKFRLDNKEFFSDDPKIASKNLPVEMVEKVQVLDRKSDMARMTGFDDGEEETIINLMIRPGMKKGTMGNALLGAGADIQNDHDLRYQGAAFLNTMQNNDQYTFLAGINNNNNMGAADLGANQFGGMRMRRGGGSGGITESSNWMLRLNKEFSPKASLNGDVRYSTSDQQSITDVTQSTVSTGKSQLDRTWTSNNYISNSLSANFTFEWKPDTTNTLIFRPNIRYNSSRSYEQEEAGNYQYLTNDTILLTNANSNNRGSGYNLGGSLDYSHKFDKPGRVLSLNLRASYNDSYSLENSYTRYKKYETSNLPDKQDQRMENDNNTNNFRATVSWVEPLGNNNFLQGLYRISYQDTKSVNSTYNLRDDLMEPYPVLALSIAADTAAVLAPDLSRSTLRHSTEQRFGLNFKSVRAKYNYTVGFNVDPSRSVNETYQPSGESVYPYDYDHRLPNIMGDSLRSNPIRQNVTNFSPVLIFNYLFGQRSNLQVNYEGETVQPTANQLKDYTDKTRPTEWTTGNPALKTGYTNSLRVRFSKYVAATQLMYNINLNGNLAVNDITPVTYLREGGIRETTYENINGNWNTQLRGMFNMPLKNKRFTIGSFAFVNYRNQNSTVNDSENTMRNLSIMDNANINYRSDLFDIGLNASINYNRVDYAENSGKNRNTYNYGIGGYNTWYLPHNWLLETDINFTLRNGYYAGFNQSETIWNAAVTKQLFNKKFGTGSLKLQIYDILQDRKSINFATTNNGDRTTKDLLVLPSYFMCSFIYKFTAFPKSSSATEDDMRPAGRWGGPDGPRMQGPPPGGGFRPM